MLAVRRFVSVEPSREFRCFLLDGRLVAACQRRVDTVFRDLSDESTLTEMRARPRLLRPGPQSPDAPPPPDVVIERRSTYLVDVNVAAQRTDPLLFEWADILALRRSETGPRPPSETFELRVVGPPRRARAGALSSFRAPLDVAAIADAGGLDGRVAWSRLDDRLRRRRRRRTEMD